MARYVTIRCCACGNDALRTSSEVNRAAKVGAPVYCNRTCAGLARRGEVRTDAERKQIKSDYDRQRRTDLHDQLKAEKRAAYEAKKAADIEAVRAQQRKQREAQKASGYRDNYLKTDRYKKYKHEYDLRTRSEEWYGEYAEAHRLLVELERLIRQQCPDKYERLKARGYYERANECRRQKRAAQRLSRSLTQQI